MESMLTLNNVVNLSQWPYHREVCTPTPPSQLSTHSRAFPLVLGNLALRIYMEHSMALASPRIVSISTKVELISKAML